MLNNRNQNMQILKFVLSRLKMKAFSYSSLFTSKCFILRKGFVPEQKHFNAKELSLFKVLSLYF